MKATAVVVRNEVGCMEKSSNVQRIAFLADYIPRRCGIATFTADLREAIAAQYRTLGKLHRGDDGSVGGIRLSGRGSI